MVCRVLRYVTAVTLCFLGVYVQLLANDEELSSGCDDCWRECVAETHEAYAIWEKAKTAYREGHFEEAVALINHAIDDHSQQDNLFLRLERAKMREKAQNLDGCREDLNFVVEYCEAKEISPPYYLKALWGLLSLCDEEQASLAMELFTKIRENDPRLPVCDRQGNIMIISNIPQEVSIRRFADSLANTFCLTGVCKSAKDVTITEDGKIQVKLQMPCSQSSEPLTVPQATNTGWCDRSCSASAAIAYAACGRLPSWRCVAACTAAVNGLLWTCEYCCESEANWRKCAWALKTFLPPPCDPAWD